MLIIQNWLVLGVDALLMNLFDLHSRGISGLTQGALRHLEVCLGSRPLPQKLFSDRPGLNHGLLLLTGPRGSGKTSLANALCRAMSQPPNLAAIFTMSCKPLRGWWKQLAFFFIFNSLFWSINMIHWRIWQQLCPS